MSLTIITFGCPRYTKNDSVLPICASVFNSVLSQAFKNVTMSNDVQRSEWYIRSRKKIHFHVFIKVKRVHAFLYFFCLVVFGVKLLIIIIHANRLNKLIRKATDVVGMECDSLTMGLERMMLIKLWKILDSISHPFHNVLFRHRSVFSEGLFPPKCMTERHRKSFLPVAHQTV